MRFPTIIAAFIVTFSVLAQGRDHGPPPSATAARAGSGIGWIPEVAAAAPAQGRRTRNAGTTADVAKALERAKSANRAVLWYVPTLPGSPMDRQPELDRYMMAGLWSHPEVAAMVTRRFVPLKGKPSRDDATKFGLKTGDVVEPAIVLLKPDGTVAFKVDRITTQQADWVMTLLDRELTKLGDLARASDSTEQAHDPLEAARGALLDGDRARMAKTVSALPDGAPAALLRAAVARRTGRLDDAVKALESAGTSADAQLERARVHLAREAWNDAAVAADAAAAAGGPTAHEAALLKGMAQFRGGHHDDARKTWASLAVAAPQSPFGWKAAAEAEGHGPFVRGFEETGTPPEGALLAAPTGTTVPRTLQDLPWLTRRSVSYLLEMQGDDGGFVDSQYDFGGRDSLPDVYMACTALAALALLEWRDVDPARCDAAVEKAWKYLANEAHSATDNTQERMWNHSYRMLFLARWLELGAKETAKVKAKLQEVVKLAEAQQKKGGIFAHEYPNPFVSATVLHALRQAKKSGANVNPAALKAGEEAIAKTRDDAGRFSYGTGKGDRNETFAAGRMPACELALLLGGKSNQASLVAAVETAFKHHDAYESVRKYDDHAPPHRIGGFFFYWDMLTRSHAIAAIDDVATRKTFVEKQLGLMLGLPEFDGRFIDSHELGKPYGTSMALVVLKLCSAPAP